MDEFNRKRGSYRHITQVVFNCALILLAASFPFNLKVSSILTVFVGLSWLLLGCYKNIPATIGNKYFGLFALIFLIPFVSIFYSENKDYSLLEKRLFLLVYPLLLFTSRIKLETVILILYSFAVSCTIAALYALAMTITNREVLGTEMTKDHLGITHVYFGLYLTFVIMTIGYLLVNRRKHDYLSVLSGIQILFLLFFLFALSSKMAIISLFILTVVICIRFIIKTRRWILGTFILITPIIIFLVTLNNFEVAYYRFYDLFNPENYFIGDNAWNSIGVRMSILKCISETVIHAPFIGSGIGDVQNDLDACYNHLNLPSVVGMNAHNQYLQFTMGTGVISLLIFLFVFYVCGREAFRKKNRIYQFFLLLFLLCCLTESLLERQNGTMFFSFFNSLLFLYVVRKDTPMKPVLPNGLL